MLNFSNTITFADGDAPLLSLRNFFDPEDGFVWSTSIWSEIVFSFDDNQARDTKSADLILDIDMFKAPPKLESQNLLVYLNGLRIGSFDITRRQTLPIAFDTKILKPEENILTFDTPNASMPKEYGIDDTRRLGLQLFSLQIRPAV